MWGVWTLGLSLVVGRVAAYNLGNYRPVTNDEVELMSVGYKLATQGVLGSDLFDGFFGADQHYLMTLPVQHGLEALSFSIFGTGVAQARWVSLVAGVALVWVVGWLAYRWYGLGTAIVAELLLVAWPSNLTDSANGLPWLGVARTARYDVLAVAFAWLAVALLDATLRRPGHRVGFTRRPGHQAGFTRHPGQRGVGFTLGVCCGLATLSTFTGAFVIPLVALLWVWDRRRQAFADRTLYWSVAGAALVLVPWLAFCLRYAADFSGQLAVYGGRWNLLQPTFLLHNIVDEPARYVNLLRSPTASTWLLLIGVWPAAAYAIWRSRAPNATGHTITWTSLVTFGLLLLVFDQTKTGLYAIVLWPSVCLAVSALLAGLLGWAWRQRRGRAWLQAPAYALVLGLALAVGADSQRAYQLTLAEAALAGQYLGVGIEIDAALPPDGRVLGPERWWWALHQHPYLSLRGVWFQWTAMAASGATPRFADWVTRARADSIIVNDNIRGDVRDFPETLQQQFWAFVQTCTTRVTQLDDPTYLQIEVYEITRPSPEPAACT
jgi:4-amino-4-deoxy-L-arabinose transferase-like glycosyltransferase